MISENMFMNVFKNLIYVPLILFSSQPNQQYKSSTMMLYFYYLKIGFRTDIHVHLLSFLLVIQVTYSLKFVIQALVSQRSGEDDVGSHDQSTDLHTP